MGGWSFQEFKARMEDRMEQLRGLESLSFPSLANIRIRYSNFWNLEKTTHAKRLPASTELFMCQVAHF